MPKCYGIIISLSSSLHPVTNMWSLSGLIDNIQTKRLPTQRLPITLPLHIHVFWYFIPEEIGKAFEARLVMTVDTIQKEPSEPISFNSSTPYAHLRLHGVVLDQVGEYHIHIEWRHPGSKEWIREDVFWPFTVNFVK